MIRVLVSIIIPCYNVERYIDRCINSVVNQSYENLDIILVDDGSSDSTPIICDKWAKNDNRIRVIHKENDGVANARNDALDIAYGEYISFIDSDDYVEPDYVEILLSELLDHNSDIVICDYQINDAIINLKYSSSVIAYDYAISELAKGSYMFGVLWNKMYRKSIIESIRIPKLACSEDLVFNYYAFSNSNSFCCISKKLYHYMQNADSTVHGKFGVGAFDAVTAREIILKELINTKFYDDAIFGYITSSYVVMSGCIKSNTFVDRISGLRTGVLKYKKNIFNSNKYNFNYKIRTALLWLLPKLYIKIVGLKG